MPHLSVQIVRFVDGSLPRFVECKFRGATGMVHTIMDKVPVVTEAMLGSDSL
jgi:hypothetical protein